jgi:redox-sensitive bicupin YhaK (pirin superfamily)
MSINRRLLFLTIIIVATSIASVKLSTTLFSRPLTRILSARSIRSASTMAASANGTSPSLNFQVRKSTDRGKADHGWLKSFHTFSFADYYSPKFESYGPLRVINEDRVAPTTGFPTHRHREFEIFSYILNGELTHRDSMNNIETLTRGDVQYTSAGTGIAHSEYNDNDAKEVHFLQIWAKPGVSALKPNYYTRHHPTESKRDNLVPIIAPFETFPANATFEKEGKDEPIPIHQDMRFYASILSPGKSVGYTFQGEGARLGYVHLAQMSGYDPSKTTAGAKLLVGDKEIREGDGVFVDGGKKGDSVEFKNVGDVDAEFVWFDMGERYTPEKKL